MTEVTHDEDIDLTAATPPPGGGPNDAHVNDPEGDAWDADAEPAADAGVPSAEPATPSESDDTPPRQAPPPAPPEPASEEATAPAGGGEEPPPAPAPAAEGKKSGAAKRGYTLLEEQRVVRVTDLTEAQRKNLDGKAVTGYVAREGDPVQGRNADLVLQQVYPDESAVAEGVTAVLPLSERNFRPIVPEFEPVQKSRLKLKRR